MKNRFGFYLASTILGPMLYGFPFFATLALPMGTPGHHWKSDGIGPKLILLGIVVFSLAGFLGAAIFRKAILKKQTKAGVFRIALGMPLLGTFLSGAIFFCMAGLARFLGAEKVVSEFFLIAGSIAGYSFLLEAILFFLPLLFGWVMYLILYNGFYKAPQEEWHEAEEIDLNPQEMIDDGTGQLVPVPEPPPTEDSYKEFMKFHRTYRDWRKLLDQ